MPSAGEDIGEKVGPCFSDSLTLVMCIQYQPAVSIRVDHFLALAYVTVTFTLYIVGRRTGIGISYIIMAYICAGPGSEKMSPPLPPGPNWRAVDATAAGAALPPPWLDYRAALSRG